MLQAASPILESLPSPDAIERRLIEIDEEARDLRQLMRLVRRRHSGDKTAPNRTAAEEGGADGC
jgi:hypothetical protein